MRNAFAGLLAALFIIAGSASVAQPSGDNPAAPAPPSPDPAQWTMSPEGNRHDGSGTNCTDDVAGFAPLEFMKGDGANLLGVCTYVDVTGTGDAGLRIRRYESGVGESRETIANDRALMEPDPVQGAPLFTVRMAPATTGDGKKGGRVTITKVRNGYLVDCFAEGATLEIASGKIARVCSN